MDALANGYQRLVTTDAPAGHHLAALQALVMDHEDDGEFFLVGDPFDEHDGPASPAVTSSPSTDPGAGPAPLPSAPGAPGPDAPLQPPEPTEEAAEVTSGNSKKPFCSAATTRGKPCRAFPTAGSTLCYMHNPANHETLQEARARGGRQPRPDDHIRRQLLRLRFDFSDLASIQALLELLAGLQLTGHLSPRRAGPILRSISLAIRNAPNVEPADHQRFIQYCIDYLKNSDDIARQLHHAENADRARAIADAGARRAEFLRTNERFGLLQPQPAPMPKDPATGPRSSLAYLFDYLARRQPGAGPIPAGPPANG